MSQADEIRRFLVEHYIEPARARGEIRVSIRSGDVHRQMNLQNAMPAVCQVLDGRRFHNAAGVRITSRDGPAASSTVIVNYELLDVAAPQGSATRHEVRNVHEDPGRMPAVPVQSAASADWFWEGNVVGAIARHLEAQGWAIVSIADTATKARGADIHARKDSATLLVEVKGFPSKAYRDPKRVSERKATAPTTQAQHWYSHALLKALRLQNQAPDAFVAIGLPDFPRYRSLIGETKAALGKIGIDVLIVGLSGQVERLFLSNTDMPSRSPAAGDMIIAEPS